MADRAISELTQATEVTDSDLFVLQQSDTAKKLSGATLKNYVVLDVVSAEAQTLPAGSNATANYDKANKTLQIGVPTGLTGATGPQGPKGDKGDKGEPGEPDAVKYVAQTLTDEQKAQARHNIAAAEAAAVGQLQQDLSDNAKSDAVTKRSLDALWKLNEGISYDFVIDDTEAYSKVVPSGCKYGALRKVSGKTISWNQMISNGHFSGSSFSGWNTVSQDYVSIEFDGECCICTQLQAASEYYRGGARYYRTFEADNKYFVSVDVNVPIVTSVQIALQNSSYIVKAITSAKTVSSVDTWTKISGILSPTEACASCGFFVAPNPFPVGTVYKLDNAFVVDLTRMFGIGNEPSTTDDSRIKWIEQYLAEHPEYNAGTLISATAEAIMGKTIPWNQLIKNGDFTSATSWGSNWGDTGSGTLAVENGIMKYTVTTTAPNRYGNALTQYSASDILNADKIFVHYKIKFPRKCQTRVDVFQNVSPFMSMLNSGFVSCNANVWTEIRSVLTPSSYDGIGKNFAICLQGMTGDTLQIGDVVEIKDVRLVNLTQIFGSGNEPTDISDALITFVEQYAIANAAYDTGSEIYFDVGKSIAMENANGLTYPLVTGTGGIQVGWSAGEVCNSFERTETGWQVVQRVGKATSQDNWIKYGASSGGLKYIDLRDASIKAGGAAVCNLLVKKDGPSSWNSTTPCFSIHDSNPWIRVFVDAESGDAFKEKYADIVIYYELADPIVRDLTDVAFDIPPELDLFPTEPGGSIVFRNAAQLPLHSTVEYVRSLKEVAE